MKWNLKFLIIAVITIGVYNKTYAQRSSDGIRFEEGKSWASIKAQAKKENKYIFVDCHTTWCGWCKWMDKNIFSLKEVGDFFNNKFISVRVQMDITKTDNENIRRWYNDAKALSVQYDVVHTFPVYLFFDSNGKVVHRILGAKKESKEFITEASNALNKEKQYYQLVEQFESGRKDSTFLWQLIGEARSRGDTKIRDVASQLYIENLKTPFQAENIEFIAFMALKTGKTNHASFLFILNNQQKVGQIIGNDKVNYIISTIAVNEVLTDQQLYEQKPDWNNFSNTLVKNYPQQAELIKKFIASSKVNYQEDKINYYTKIYDWSRFRESIIKYNEACRQKRAYNHSHDKDFNSWAWASFKNITDRKGLQAALDLSKASLEEKGDAELFDTYANLLYKLYKLHKMGSLEIAIEWEEKALKNAKKDGLEENVEKFNEVITMMKKGYKTWELLD